jgi:hypothetical protein
MAFLRTGYSVAYEPITVHLRHGQSQSHLKPLSDGIAFLLIIYKITILYSPLKVFASFACLFFAAGIANYAYTYILHGRFTNMSAFFFSVSVIIFLVGCLSEQITCLMYSQSNREFH